MDKVNPVVQPTVETFIVTTAAKKGIILQTR